MYKVQEIILQQSTLDLNRRYIYNTLILLLKLIHRCIKYVYVHSLGSTVPWHNGNKRECIPYIVYK